MSAPAAPAPAPAPAKKSNVLLWVLLGCGGFVVVAVVGLLLLAVLGGAWAQRELESAQVRLVQMRLTDMQAQLAIYLSGDDAAQERVDEAFEALEEAARDGGIDSDDLAKLDREFETATGDANVSPEELDRLLDVADSLGR